MQFKFSAFTALAIASAVVFANPMPNPGSGGVAALVARGASGGSTSEQWGKTGPEWPGQGDGPWKGKGPKPNNWGEKPKSDNWGDKSPCCQDSKTGALVQINIGPNEQCPSGSHLVYIKVDDLLSVVVGRGEPSGKYGNQWGDKGAEWQGPDYKPSHWGNNGHPQGPKPSNWGKEKPCCKDKKTGALIQIDIDLDSDEQCPSGTELVYISVGDLLSIGISL